MRFSKLRHHCALGALAGALALVPVAAQAQDAEADEATAESEADTSNVIIVRA